MFHARDGEDIEDKGIREAHIKTRPPQLNGMG